ncbi:MAG: indolepyruvate oxidoreductase subunit beta [bacterium]|nr:indolepyruvate oxidoreductase subunit beta [bacterium]MDW8164202.1 indolepyruvate oxidoreductase subunit beta [Candidatus Omnitrophota bacterium]
MKNKFDILICGVGGQGIILCSNIIGIAGVIEGLKVKGSEIHGMSQRGGSVEAFVRLNCDFGPKIPIGQADLIIGFEPMEACRVLHYLNKNGIMVVNSFPILIQGYDYEEVIKFLKSQDKQIYIENFTSIAEKIGSVKVLNTLMLGYASKFIPLKKESFLKVMENYLPKNILKVNLDAFNFFSNMRDKEI